MIAQAQSVNAGLIRQPQRVQTGRRVGLIHRLRIAQRVPTVAAVAAKGVAQPGRLLLREQAVAENVIVTLGREGILIHASGSGHAQWITDRLPAFNRSPKDPAGAGDVLFVLASMAIAAKRPIWEAAYLGSLAAACQVGRVGNIPLTSQELHTEIDQ